MAALPRLCMLLICLMTVAHANVAASPNLIKNGNFESGKLDPWRFGRFYKRDKAGYTIASGCLKNGKRCFQYSAPTVYDPEDEGSVAGFTISQNITTAAGAAYSLSFDYLSEMTKMAPHGTGSYFVSAGDMRHRSNFVKSGKIFHFARNFNAEAAKTEVAISFYADPYYDYDSRQFTQLDNIVVTRIKD